MANPDRKVHENANSCAPHILSVVLIGLMVGVRSQSTKNVRICMMLPCGQISHRVKQTAAVNALSQLRLTVQKRFCQWLWLLFDPRLNLHSCLRYGLIPGARCARGSSLYATALLRRWAITILDILHSPKCVQGKASIFQARV